MSYDLYLSLPKCPTCGRSEEFELRYNSPTYNYGSMIRTADELAGGEGCSFAAIDGKTGEEASLWFARILDSLVTNKNKIQPLEPENGWGTYKSLIEAFRYYAMVCKERPKEVWRQDGDGSYGMRCCAGWKVEEKEAEK